MSATRHLERVKTRAIWPGKCGTRRIIRCREGLGLCIPRKRPQRWTLRPFDQALSAEPELTAPVGATTRRPRRRCWRGARRGLAGRGPAVGRRGRGFWSRNRGCGLGGSRLGGQPERLGLQPGVSLGVAALGAAFFFFAGLFLAAFFGAAFDFLADFLTAFLTPPFLAFFADFLAAFLAAFFEDFFAAFFFAVTTFLAFLAFLLFLLFFALAIVILLLPLIRVRRALRIVRLERPIDQFNPGFGPPVAQSRSSIVCTTGTDVPLAI